MVSKVIRLLKLQYLGLWTILSAGMLSQPCVAATLLVGPQYPLKLPSQAAQLAKDGDWVLIAADSYPGDVAVWKQNQLTIRGVAGRPHLIANGRSAEGKAIWVLKGDHILVENIEFSGAQVADLNGAGIRFEGSHLILRNCHFHHNQMGILTGANPSSDILIEGSEFNHNTVDFRRYGKLGHNIYIGSIRRFTLSHSYIHDAQTGHNVKSRAMENYLLYNRIGDEQLASSYLVDFPDGGEAFVIGNQFRQAPDTENASMLSFAAEHQQNQITPLLYLVNNTFVNDRASGIFVNNHSSAPAILINNLLIGQNSHIAGNFQQQHSISSEQKHFLDAGDFNYRLAENAEAIDQGITPGQAANGFALSPIYQYRHPVSKEARQPLGPIDVGAYEFISNR